MESIPLLSWMWPKRPRTGWRSSTRPRTDGEPTWSMRTCPPIVFPDVHDDGNLARCESLVDQLQPGSHALAAETERQFLQLPRPTLQFVPSLGRDRDRVSALVGDRALDPGQLRRGKADEVLAVRIPVIGTTVVEDGDQDIYDNVIDVI